MAAKYIEHKRNEVNSYNERLNDPDSGKYDAKNENLQELGRETINEFNVVAICENLEKLEVKAYDLRKKTNNVRIKKKKPESP